MSSVFLEHNPCVSCGACCAFFRAAFYWGEGDDCEGGTVPTELVDDLPPYRRVMKGTNQPNPRCIALQGEIGKDVHCAIYTQRSTTCRAFPYSWADGVHNPDCDKARAGWGLPPLEPPALSAQTIPLSSESSPPTILGSPPMIPGTSSDEPPPVVPVARPELNEHGYIASPHNVLLDEKNCSSETNLTENSPAYKVVFDG